jgi:hypothetical protein
VSPEEATDGAAERHEFREFVPLPTLGGVTYLCYCSHRGPVLSSEVSARNAHERHQLNASLQRSYERRPHL